MKTILKIILLSSIVMLLTACQQDKEDLAAFVAMHKAQKQSDIPPLPVVKPYEKFEYAAADLKDPFIQTVVETSLAEEVIQVVDNGINPDQHRLKEALESYGLSELQFVGTLEQESRWALVRSSDGVIHRVKVGNYMGQNHGKILTISENEITMKEIVPEGDGRYIERDSSLSVVDVN